MPLPTDVDYQEALQNPRGAFLDPELQQGRPEVQSSALPFPRARSGNFAVAFRMNCASRSWAVKCFTRALHADLQERYTAISSHLARAHLPYSVGFTFLPGGIRVRNEVFPLLKMEWIDGESLNRSIERNLGNQAAILGLAKRWLEMLRALQAANVCHGDLQHGNVLVVGNELRLIDYDGMYVPALTGRDSHERGHDNYQHPNRDREFGPGLDNFSAWVVFVSLLALAHEPSLWREHRGGDECLLFRKADFVHPDRSQLLASLLSSREPRVRTLASLFRTLLYLPPQQVPSLDGQFLPTTAAANAPAPQLASSWVADHRKSESQTPVQSDSPLTAGWDLAAPGGLWVLDHTPSLVLESPSFARPPTLERTFAIASVAAIALVAFGLARGAALFHVALAPALMLANAVLWLLRYRSEGVRRARERKAQEVAIVQAEVETIDRSLRAIARHRQVAERSGAAKQEELRKAARRLDAEMTAALEPHRASCKQGTVKIRAERDKASREHAAVMQRLHATIGADLLRVQRDLMALGAKETTELAALLTAAQQQHVATALGAASVDLADIPGVKDALKERLRAAGIRTAADADQVHYCKVEGIGEKKTASILAWRSAIEAKARATAPTALPASNVHGVRSKYAHWRRGLETEMGQLQTQLAGQTASADRNETHTQRAFAAREAAELDRFARAERAIQSQYEQRRAGVASELARETRVTGEQIAGFDARAQDTRRIAFATMWRREAVLREYALYDTVSFRRFAARSAPPAIRVAAILATTAALTLGLLRAAQSASASSSVVPTRAPPSERPRFATALQSPNWP
jgi:hypothetical protein